MNTKKLEIRYKKKIGLFNKYNNEYYNKSKPSVSDEEYDNLKKKILSLEDKYKFLKSKNSPSNNIGHKPSKNFKKVSHRVPMLSLANAFTEDDLVNLKKY